MPKAPLRESDFQLDVSGIAGFFGGEESFAAMSSIHLVRGRRWLGWYNSPGSYFVAKKYGVLARSRIWDGLYPGVNVDPTTMLELDGKVGPRYVAAHSGTRLPSTGHLAYLFAQHCDEHFGEVHMVDESTKSKSDLFLTIVHLEDFKEFEGYPKVPAKSFGPFDPLAIIPIGFSVAACVLSAVFEDWYCFSLILLGILTNGISCVVIGSGVLKVRQPNPSPYSPPGDGILDGYPRVILMKGSEKTVQGITRGKYYLEYNSESQYHDIGICAVLLTIQFLGQLFLIPQGTLFGQIMFLASLGVSWLFNAYLASVDNEALQTSILHNVLLHQPTTKTVRLPKRTALVVFAAVYMGTKDPRSFLDEMIPNDTAVWRLVKDTISEAITRDEDPESILGEKSQQVDALDDNDKGLLSDMLRQAGIGFHGAKNYKFK